MLCEAVARLSIVEYAAAYMKILYLQAADAKLKLCSPYSCSSHSDEVRFGLKLAWDMCIVRAAGVGPEAWERDLL